MVLRSTEASALGMFSLSIKSIITMLTQKSLHGTPEELNKVEFTVEFRKENAEVTRSLNNFLDKRFLPFEVRMLLKNATAATNGILRVATRLALTPELPSNNSPLQEHLAHPLWFVRKRAVSGGENH